MTRRPFDPFGEWRDAAEEHDPIEDAPEWETEWADRKRDERSLSDE